MSANNPASSAPVSLLLGFHAHQPVGNFEYVIDNALRRCYGRFFEVLERHPKIRFSLHISGWLLDYLHREFPDDIARVARMVQRGQVEMIGGGYTEPILAAISERDRRDQLREMYARIRDLFGVQPRGAWLTERVWESAVVPALADTGIRFVAVDDYHFLSAGRSAGELNGYFTTEESSKRLDLFPISEALRYMIPFVPAADVVDALERYPVGTPAIYFDDLEKFGIWPDTFEWVYEGGWLEEFLTRLETSERVTTQTFGEFHRRRASNGLVYLPATSYAEMNEWTLPASGARHLRQMAERSRFSGTLGDDRPYLRGGTWKNFLSKYPEANWMHKRMQQASRRMHALPRSVQTQAMHAALHRAQANDAYWHGLFGGLYLPFLRRSIYANLASLDEQIDRIEPRPPSAEADIDLDGHREIALRSGRFHAVIRPQDGGSLCELTDYPLAHNFADALARRDEEYYDVIRMPAAERPAEKRAGIASIHERTVLQARIDPADLEPDHAPRGMFVDMWYEAGATSDAIVRYRGAPLAGEAAATCSARLDGLTIEKSYRIERDTLLVRYEIAASRPVAGALGVQLNVAMPSCEGEGGRFSAGGASLGRFSSELHLPDAGALVLDDDVLGGRLELAALPSCDIKTAPLFTVSRSEFGFEKIMQAATLTMSWVIALDAGERAERSIMLRCVTARSLDRVRADAPEARGTDTSGSGTAPGRTSPDEDRA